ncbi:MAG: AraC family transcriptional regulator [Sphaerochaetaceae bacterium]|nr:AraC family transcriptional regulator [Sphaerochaetaceae bacterium]
MDIIDAVFVFQMHDPEELSWHQRTHHHEEGQFELHYFLEGSGTFLNGPTRYTIRPGSLYISNGTTTHAIRVLDESEPLTYYAVLLQVGQNDTEIIAQLEMLQKTMPLVIGSNYRFFFEEIKDRGLAQERNTRLSACYQLLSLLFRFGEKPLWKGNDATVENIHLEKAIRIMQRHIFDKLTLDDICAELRLTNSYFIRMFNKRIHQPPMKYYMGLKLEAARSMLSTANLSVKEIAAKLCFSSEFHFSKQFKASTDMSPSEYRKHQARTYSSTLSQ